MRCAGLSADADIVDIGTLEQGLVNAVVGVVLCGMTLEARVEPNQANEVSTSRRICCCQRRFPSNVDFTCCQVVVGVVLCGMTREARVEPNEGSTSFRVTPFHKETKPQTAIAIHFLICFTERAPFFIYLVIRFAL